MRKLLLALTFIILLTSCTGAQVATVEPANQPPDTSTPTSGFSGRAPEKTIGPTSSVTPTILPTEIEYYSPICTCSPIENIALDEVTEIISNPFQMPVPGKDDGHHGVDFAFYRFNDLIGMDGLSVQSILPGTVVAVVSDRPPYGNMVIVETPLSDLPSELLPSLNLPEVLPTVEPFSALSCPELPSTPGWDYNQRSVYLLYAHMKNKPNFNLGDSVDCCQPLGEVGTSGSSVNEHLHLEFRVGPSGARFISMAHYDNSCTDEEMINYCIWRVSNTFQLIDPIQYILLHQNQ